MRYWWTIPLTLLLVLLPALGCGSGTPTPKPSGANAPATQTRAAEQTEVAAARIVAGSPAAVAPTSGATAVVPTAMPAAKATDTLRATDTPRPAAPTNTPSPAPPPTVAPAAAQPQQVQGTGAMAPPPVQLNAGLTLIRSRHNGQRNFIVQLLDKDAKTVDLVANVIGTYDGTKAIRVPVVGQFTLNVQADGNWTIDILQPGPAELAQNAKLPQTFSGQGTQITPFFSVQTGALRLALTHSGSRNFIVILLDSRGQTVDLSANVIGAYEGSKIVRIPGNGVYLFTVTADGAWSIDAGQ